MQFHITLPDLVNGNAAKEKAKHTQTLRSLVEAGMNEATYHRSQANLAETRVQAAKGELQRIEMADEAGPPVLEDHNVNPNADAE